MKTGDQYHKWVEWSDEDQAYIGKCPDLITGIHGSDPVQVFADLCETVASIGTALAAGLERLSLGTTLTVNHLRPARDGHVTATGVPVHVGRTSAVWDMRVTDDEGRLVAVSRLTLAIRETAPGQPAR